jgi:hypothetical protein
MRWLFTVVWLKLLSGRWWNAVSCSFPLWFVIEHAVKNKLSWCLEHEKSVGLRSSWNWGLCGCAVVYDLIQGLYMLCKTWPITFESKSLELLELLDQNDPEGTLFLSDMMVRRYQAVLTAHGQEELGWFLQETRSPSCPHLNQFISIHTSSTAQRRWRKFQK